MGTPIVALAALRTTTGRRIVIGAASILAFMVAFALTPLAAIPFIVAGSQLGTVAAKPESAPAAVIGDWTYPLAGGYNKGRGFGYNPVIGCSYCSTNHMGYDMAQGCGSAIYAAGPGDVITAGSYQGYGNTVRIDHGDGLVSLYGHMEWGSLRVSVGQTITAGTPLGAEGNTGRSFGCHLHFELLRHGASLDPQPFMAARGLPLV
jgi:murein DD-endopeptidase MepM/ murein hydrolase activator NlpD